MGKPLSGLFSENNLVNSTRISSSIYENEQRQQLLLVIPFEVINFFKDSGGDDFLFCFVFSLTLQRGQLLWSFSHLVLQPLRDWKLMPGEDLVGEGHAIWRVKRSYNSRYNFKRVKSTKVRRIHYWKRKNILIYKSRTFLFSYCAPVMKQLWPATQASSKDELKTSLLCPGVSCPLPGG